MAINNLTNQVTWLDIWKTMHPDGSNMAVANELVENNTLLQHAVWVMANDGSQHKGARVETLPTSNYKRMGEGTAPSAGSHSQYIEETQVRETWIEIEDEVLNKSPNPEGTIERHALLGVQGIIQDTIQDLIYGNRDTTPDSIKGLSFRMPALQADRKLGKVVSAGGSANANSSLWGIKWSVEDGVFLIYPKDHPNAGVKTKVFPSYVSKENGKNRVLYPVRIQFACGIGVANRRAIFRLANIDASITDANWITFVENKLVELFNDCPNSGAGFRLYANNFLKTKFDIRAKDKGNIQISPKDPYNLMDIETTKFGKFPVSSLERLIANEANVA